MRLLICLLLCLSILQSCGNDDDQPLIPSLELQNGINELMISHAIDGITTSRTVYIRTPENLNNSISYPVVFFFHGAGGSGQNFLQNKYIVELINSGHFIGIFPNGHSDNSNSGGFWNLGSEPTSANDVEFVNLIFEQLKTSPIIDITKSYAAGFSNGAGMVNLLGKSTQHFNSIAPLFSQQIISIGELTPLRNLSVFQVNGEVDNLIPLNGGTSPVGTFLSAEDSARNWATHNNCNSIATQEVLDWGGTELSAYYFQNCSNNNEVKYFVAHNVGHGFMNEQTEELLYNQLWEFFRNH